MTALVPITCTGCTSVQLHDLASRSKSLRTSRRLMAIAMIEKGVARSTVAEVLKVTTRSVRNWVVRYNTQGGLWTSHVRGARPVLASRSGT